MQRSMTMIALCASVWLSSLAASAQPAPSVVLTWNTAALAEIRQWEKLGPPATARALAILHTCMFDAWTPYTPTAVGFAYNTQGAVRQPASTLAKETAIGAAAYSCARNLFGHRPGALERLAAVRDPMPQDDTATQIGLAAAEAVLAWRADDGANQGGQYADTTGYRPRNTPLAYCLPHMTTCPPFHLDDPLHWQPLISPAGVTQVAVGPQWGQVRPFVLASATQFDTSIPPPTIQHDAVSYRAEAEEIIALSAALTPAQKLVVEYWADGPTSEFPAGHAGLLAQFVSTRDEQTLDEDVVMLTAMHHAAADAGLVAWHTKYKYDGVRPISVIRHLFTGRMIQAWGGPGKPTMWIPGDQWSPYNPGPVNNLSPGFPAYLSGHAIFTSAALGVLRHLTGSDRFDYTTTLPANFGRVEPGIPLVPTTLTFATFTEAVQSASDSRLYAGIHFVQDCTVGIAVGQQIADVAVQVMQGHLHPAPALALAR